MNTLKPVEISDYYIKKIASGMSKYFWTNIFSGIFEILNDNKINNSTNNIINALQNGSIWYENGAFHTANRFTNNVAKTLEEMGATYRRKAYYIEPNKLPNEILNTITLVKSTATRKALEIEQYLIGLTPILEKLTARDLIQLTVKEMYKKLELDILKSAQEYKLPVIGLDIVSPKVKTSKKQQKEIEQYWKEQDKKASEIRTQISKAKTSEEKDELRQKLVEHQKETYANAPTLDVKLEEYELNKVSEEIANDYVYNMNYWIKKWEAKNIIEMRKEIADMVQKGVRVPEIQAYFQKRWKIAKNKALFLAENESRLAGSVIQATQYQKLGCTQFKWGRSTSIEKRKLHKEYYNKIFDFDNPPIIDEKLGIKGLPRQIWNCKCQMLCVAPSLAQTIKRTEEIRNAKRNIFTKIKNSMQRSNSNWRYRRYGEG
jgi:hypothetical protein